MKIRYQTRHALASALEITITPHLVTSVRLSKNRFDVYPYDNQH